MVKCTTNIKVEIFKKKKKKGNENENENEKGDYKYEITLKKDKAILMEVRIETAVLFERPAKL